MNWCWWNLSCRRRCCLIYVQFPWRRKPMWTDDEDHDERCRDWRWRRAVWWHKLSDASEKFSACIFKVEGNPDGQLAPVPSKLSRTFCHILRQWSKKRSLKVTHCKHSVKVYSDTLQRTLTSTSLIFFFCLNYLLSFLNSLFPLLHLLCLLSVILPVSSTSHTSYSSSTFSSSSLAICPKPVRIKVLRPATSAQVFLGFPLSISECWNGSQDSKLLLHASYVAIPTSIS